MEPFEKLTERGQILRMRALVERVLLDYDLPVKNISFLARMTNYLFRIDSLTGERYVLRIYSDDDSTIVENHTEVFWLSALHRDTDLRIITPVRRRDGDFISIVSMDGIPPERRCVLFNWVPGKPLAEQATPGLYHQFGGMMARLHDHSAQLTLPDGICPKRWDRVFYYPGEHPVYKQQQFQHLFSEGRVEMMDEAVRRCDKLLAGLYQGSMVPMFIHGDLQFGNIHLSHGKLYFLDFEDVCLGYPVQDVAISLYYGRTLPEYSALVHAFQQGYSAVRPWPVESPQQLAGLMAARNANFINYVAGLLPEPQEMLHGMFTRLEQFLVLMGKQE